MIDNPRDEIEYSRTGQFTTAGVVFPSHIIFAAQTSCISEETE